MIGFVECVRGCLVLVAAAFLAYYAGQFIGNLVVNVVAWQMLKRLRPSPRGWALGETGVKTYTDSMGHVWVMTEETAREIRRITDE